MSEIARIQIVSSTEATMGGVKFDARPDRGGAGGQAARPGPQQELARRVSERLSHRESVIGDSQSFDLLGLGCRAVSPVYEVNCGLPEPGQTCRVAAD